MARSRAIVDNMKFASVAVTSSNVDVLLRDVSKAVLDRFIAVKALQFVHFRSF